MVLVSSENRCVQNWVYFKFQAREAETKAV